MTSDSPFISSLVTPKQLHEALQQETSTRIVVLSSASFPPGDGRKGIDAFRERRIPGSRFFDLDKVADHESGLPHTLPTGSVFASALSALGVEQSDVVVVYDTHQLGITSAPRAAWTLKVFGHERVQVLNNFKLWVEEGYPVESGEPRDVKPSQYPVPALDKSKVVDFDEVKEIAIENKKRGTADGIQILDARAHGRWTGDSPEPRPGLPSGHIPGSISIPVNELLDPLSKTLLPAEQLRRLFKEKGVDPERPIITSCGSGVTAAVIDIALAAADYGLETDRRLYDGSWFEWAQRVQTTDGLIKKSSDP